MPSHKAYAAVHEVPGHPNSTVMARQECSMQYVNVTVTYIQTPCLAIAFCTCTQCRQELTAVALVLFIIVARAVEEPVVILAQVGMMKLVICRLSLVMFKVRSTLPNPLHDPVLVKHARVL